MIEITKKGFMNRFTRLEKILLLTITFLVSCVLLLSMVIISLKIRYKDHSIDNDLQKTNDVTLENCINILDTGQTLADCIILFGNLEIESKCLELSYLRSDKCLLISAKLNLNRELCQNILDEIIRAECFENIITPFEVEYE